MKRREILVLAIAQFFVALSTGLIGPVYAIYFEKIVKETSLVALVIGIYWITVGILEVPSGYLSDRIGKGKTFLIGGIISSIAIFLYLFISDLNSLIIVEILNAIGHSLQMPSFISLLSEVTSSKNRGKEIGFVDSFWSITYGISAIISGAVISLFGIFSIFIISSLFNVLSSVIVGRKFSSFKF